MSGTPTVQQNGTQHTPGPMEQAVRRDAYIGEQDSILQAAVAADKRQADLLAALELVLPKVMATRTDCLCDAPEIDAPCTNCRIRTARAAIAKARGEAAR